MRVITLTIEDNTERQEHFAETYPSELPEYELYVGLNASTVVIPAWWEGTAGFAACRDNYIDIFRAIASETEPVLMFEDDCTFDDSFGSKFVQLVSELPADWQVLNLAAVHIGSSMHTPEQVTPHLLRAKACTCTSSMLIHPEGAAIMAAALSEENWACHHVPDNQIAISMLRGNISVYTPIDPICGQMGGQSTGNPNLVWPLNWRPDPYYYRNTSGILIYTGETTRADAVETESTEATE